MTRDDGAFELARIPVHLGLGATVVPQEPFTGEMSWYQRYEERTTGDGIEGRLVAWHTFTESWDSWEVHPHGEELVVCLAGEISLIQDVEGTTRVVTMGPGEAAVNAPGVWHTADIEGHAAALFITAGSGTRGRPR